MYSVIINLKTLFSHLVKFYISDINIISYPKSGRTWLIEIINELNLFNKTISKKNSYFNNNKFKKLEYKKLNKKIFFENLTMAPIEKKLINYKLLDTFEKNYLFRYHLNVYSKISKYLNFKEKKWLASFI